MATQSEIAAHCDLTQQQVSKLIHKYGLPARNCDIDTFRVTYIRELRETAAGRQSANGGDLDLVEERARQAHHDANIKALVEAEKNRELVNAEEVVDMWTKQIAAVRAKLLSIPTKNAPVAAIEVDAHVIEELLTDSIHEALNELSETGMIDETDSDME